MAKHNTPDVVKPPRMQKAGKADRATQKLAPKHSDSGAKQIARDSKQLITFGASKTKNAAVLSFDNKLAPQQKPIKSVVKYRHQITLQFWIGLIAILTDRTPANKASGKQNNFIIQLAAWIIVYAILFGISSAGQGAAKISSSLGWLILGGLIMQQEYVRTKNNVPSRFAVFQNNKAVSAAGGGGGPIIKAE